MSDLIDRQAAIDLIKSDAFWVQYTWGGRGHKPEMEMVDDLVESIIKQMKESVVSRLKQMPSAQPEQRWIPCSERMPEEKDDYLCSYNGCEVVDICEYDPDRSEWGFFYDGGWKVVSNVIAWMPLPEPWRGEEHEI